MQSADGVVQGLASVVVKTGAAQRFFQKVIQDRDAAAPLIPMISPEAKAYACEVTNIEDFFVLYQNFNTREETVQFIITSLFHHLRISYDKNTLVKSTAIWFGSKLGASSEFSLSLENLYYLTLLLEIEKVVHLPTALQQIEAFERINAGIIVAHRKVMDNQSDVLDIGLKRAFLHGLKDVRKNIKRHIERLQFADHVAPVAQSFKDIAIEMEAMSKGLIRVLQYLHCPERDFTPLNALSPALCYPHGVPIKTKTALRVMTKMISGRSLFEVAARSIDPSIEYDANELLALSLPTSTVSSGLLSVYGEKAQEFAEAIQEAYQVQTWLSNFLATHAMIAKGVYAFGEIMLANHPLLKGVMQRHLKLMDLRMVQAMGLIKKIETLFASIDSIVEDRLLQEVSEFEEIQKRLKSYEDSVSQKLGKFESRRYLESFLLQFIDVAIHEADTLSSTVSPSDVKALALVESSKAELDQLRRVRAQLQYGKGVQCELIELDASCQVQRYGLEDFLSGRAGTASSKGAKGLAVGSPSSMSPPQAQSVPRFGVRPHFYDLVPHEAGGAGNCFFLSIGAELRGRCPEKILMLEGLFPGVPIHHALRLLAVGTLLALKEEKRPDIAGFISDDTTVTEILKLAQDGVDARNLIIPFMAIALGVTIVIVNNRLSDGAFDGVFQPPLKYSARGPMLYCYYMGNIRHYQPLRGTPSPTLDIEANVSGSGVHDPIDSERARDSIRAHLVPSHIPPSSGGAKMPVEPDEIHVSYSPREVIRLYNVPAAEMLENGLPSAVNHGTGTTTSIGGFSSVNLDIPDALKSPAGRLHFVLFNIRVVSRRWALSSSLDALAVINASNIDNPNGKSEQSKNAKRKLRAFIVSHPHIASTAKKTELTAASFAQCTFSELAQIIDLLRNICRLSKEDDKKALGAHLEMRLKEYFIVETNSGDRPAPESGPTVSPSPIDISSTGVPPKRSELEEPGYPSVVPNTPSDPSTSITADSESRSEIDGKPSIAPKGVSVPFDLPLHEPSSIINFVDVIEQAKNGYSRHTLRNKSSTAAVELGAKLRNKREGTMANQILIENTAYFVRYILCESESRVISASLRVRMLASICSRPDMHNLILEGTDTSEDIMLLVLRDIILLHLGINLHQRHRPDSPEGLLFECLSLLISSNLKHALRSRFFTSNQKIGERVEGVVKDIMSAPIGSTTLVDILRSARPINHAAILGGLQAEIKGVPSTKVKWMQMA